MAWRCTGKRASIFGVAPDDPRTFLVVPALLGCVALLACYLPAHRTGRVEPMVVMRGD